LLLFVCKVNNKIIKINKYILINVYINNLDSNYNLVVARFIVEIYLIENLEINVLIEINMLNLQKINLDFNYYLVKIDACKDFTISINIINKLKS